jgi:hypothetical protein
MRDLIGITYDVGTAGPELTAAEWRQVESGMFVRDTNDIAYSGVRGGAVSNVASSVTIAPLTAIVHPTAALGVYKTAFPAGATELAKTITAAHLTLARIDALDIKVFDHEADGSGLRGADIQLTAGTASGSPTAPTFTGVGIRLGTFAVPASGGGSPVWTVNPNLIGYSASGGFLDVNGSPINPKTGAGVFDRSLKMMKYWDGTNWIKLLAGASPVTATSSIDESTSTSASFVAGSTPLGIVFVAPPSGNGFITLGAYFGQLSNAQASIVSYTVRAGGTIGSGTTFGAAANSDRALVCGRAVNASAPALLQADIRDYWPGLTPGSTYNARVEFQTTSGGGCEVYKRKLTFEPSL